MLVTALKKQIKLLKKEQKVHSTNVLWITLLALSKTMRYKNIFESGHDSHSSDLLTFKIMKISLFFKIFIRYTVTMEYNSFFIFIKSMIESIKVAQTTRKLTVLKQCGSCNLSIQYLSNALISQR